MSKKLDLAIKYVELRKEFDGEYFKPMANNIEYLSTHFRVRDLEDKIEAVKNAIIAKENRIKNEAYLETPEGKALAEKLKDEKTVLIANRKALRDLTRNKICESLKKMLGEDWSCIYSPGFKFASVEIGLAAIDPNRIKQGYVFEFGHTFTITLAINWDGDKATSYEVNYGTLGSFELFGNGLRQKYLAGMATVVNNKEWLKELQDTLMEDNKVWETTGRKIDEINAKLSNPLNL